MKRSLYRLFRLSSAFQWWVSRRFTPAGFGLIGCLFLSALIGMDTNESRSYQLFMFLLALLGIAIATQLGRRDRITATRHLPRFATVGVPLTYRIVLHSQARKLRTGVKVYEEWLDPRPTFQAWATTPDPFVMRRPSLDRASGYYRWRWLLARNQRARAKAISVPPLHPHQKTEVVAELTPTHRGVIRLRGLTVAYPDPLGLSHACVTVPLPQSLLVLPKIYPLPPIQLPGLRRYQSGGVALASSVGDSEEFRSLRDYRPGDSLRKIHWKSWAKVGKPIVKEEQDEFFVRHALILDTFQRETYSDTLEAAISVAASFACEVQTQESLLDLMFVGTEAYCFTVGRGLGHTDRMLEILASVNACPDHSFEYLIPVVVNRLSLLSGCICVLLSWDEPRQRLIHHLQAMQIPTLVLVISQDGSLDRTTVSAQDTLTTVHVLSPNRLQEGLMAL